MKGESGPHVPDLYEKWTQPPRPYTEATLLRAMETAGKLVDNDELRDALKENGIGRPSTRAAIIETLFKRNYIRKEKKNLIATSTGVELIQIIHEELLKSAELTGIWEKKLREIEKKTYNAAQFLEELKQMVSEVVMSVLSDNSNRHITIVQAVQEATADGKNRKAAKEKMLRSLSVRVNRGKRLLKLNQSHRLMVLRRQGIFRQMQLKQILLRDKFVRCAAKEPLLKVKPLMVALNGRTDVRFVRRLVRNERYNNLPIFQFIRMSYEK